jgi:prepilin-type N-terminal cleavage/methylation domain-containing protein
MRRSAFTLIELMISVVILSIIMLFLYKSYSTLNKSNDIFTSEVLKLTKMQKIKTVMFLDFSTSRKGSINIINQDRKNDVVFLQTSNSIHDRVEPYVAYVLKNKHLYRLESFRPYTGYPFGADDLFDADDLGSATDFRIYKSNNKKRSLYLINVIFNSDEEILIKTEALNQI